MDEQFRIELLRRAIALGEELVKLADDLGHGLAGTHLCQGVELMRAEIERYDAAPHA